MRVEFLSLILLIGSTGLISCSTSTKSGTVQNGLENYAKMARSVQVEDGQSDGSLWSSQAGYADAFRDVKARRVADLVTIQVLESTSAVSEASTETVRDSSVDVNIPNLFGLEGRVAALVVGKLIVALLRQRETALDAFVGAELLSELGPAVETKVGP